MTAHALTLSSRNTAVVQHMLRRYGQTTVARARGAVKQSRDRMFVTAQMLCPRDTDYMANHMRDDLSDDNLSYEVGFDSADFVGKVNPATGKTITEFYPLYQEFGTSRMPAQPCIFPAAEAERPLLRQALKQAMQAPRGAQPSGRR